MRAVSEAGPRTLSPHMVEEAERRPLTLEEERDLAINFSQGSQGAFSRLFEAHVNGVYRHFFYRVGGNPAIAEDLTAETFFKAWKNRETYHLREDKTFGNWLNTIAANLLRDSRSRADWNTEYIGTDDHDSNTPRAKIGDPEHDAARVLQNEKLQAAFAALRGKRKRNDAYDAVVMKHVYGMEYKDIARNLAKSEGAVRVSVTRGVAFLREHLEELSPRPRKSVNMSAEEGLDYSQLADMTGTSRNAIVSRIKWARHNGKLQLKREERYGSKGKLVFRGEDREKVLRFLGLGPEEA